ncbi:hypothetical protein OS493_038848 [Desmophyllum pertusum]|uniref:Uncharacterized protein n=1 Tax=Desmophyllum pertusum TaxID=174260 RepID=A0A9X0D127_9CNID|nr:hypothetical protein OS493_038848 [Desmophyllum pertusum]
MAEAPAPGVQFPQPLVNPPAQGPHKSHKRLKFHKPRKFAQAAQVPQAVQVAQAAQVLPAAQGVPVPQAAQAAGQNAAQNVAAGGTQRTRAKIVPYLWIHGRLFKRNVSFDSREEREIHCPYS